MPSGKNNNNQQPNLTDGNLQISLPLDIEVSKDIMSRNKLSLAEISENLNNAVYGSYFILIRPNQQVINPTYLSLYLNFLVGRLQTEQANTGTIQTNLTIPVLESLLIACPPL